MSTNRTILHEGEEFVLHHHPGNASYVLVTFVGSNQEGTATRDFLLSRLVETYDIPCLGVTCKTRNMYTSTEMDRVLEAASPILRRYTTVVVIGHSIGGYAAIKFSRRLGATHVLAVTPMYSLDTDELVLGEAADQLSLEHHCARYGIAQQPTFKGMAIRADETSGRIVVVNNPHSALDVYQMNHLRPIVAVEEVPLQDEGHNVFSSLERSETMSKLIDALRFSGPTELRRAFRAIRHSNPSCMVPVLRRAMVRHPLLVHQALRSNAVAITPGLSGLDHGALSNEVAYRLAECGHQAQAFERLERTIRRALGKSVRLASAHESGGTADLQPGRQYLLLSSHGSFLCATTVTSKLSLGYNPFSTEGLTPVFASASNDGLMLRTMSHDGRLSAPIQTDTGQSVLDWSRLDGRITLATASGAMSAHRDDTITYGPGSAERSAQFLPALVDEPAGFIQRRSTDWLDSIARGVSEATSILEPQTTARPASSGGGWNRLLRLVGR